MITYAGWRDRLMVLHRLCQGSQICYPSLDGSGGCLECYKRDMRRRAEQIAMHGSAHDENTDD